jgi:hypothetical protein
VFEPVASSTPEPVPEPEPLPDDLPDDLPDFVIVPGSERPPEPQPQTPPAAAEAGLAGLGFPTITELILDPERAREGDQGQDRKPAAPQQEPRPRPPRARPTRADRRANKERRRRSSEEPGDEYEETGWMHGLSNRLSAYSVDEDGAQEDGKDPEAKNS